MLICFAIGIGIVKEETNHIVESKGVEIKKNREREERKKVVCFMSWRIMLQALSRRIRMSRQF